jgi:uncharacterized protein YbjT (DUF2867 family)
VTVPILVTGGTGTLGRALVPRLRDAGLEHRVLSRRDGPGLVSGDLSSGRGIDDAVRGASAIIHLTSGPKPLTRPLLDAALRHGRPDLVFVSIVGIDRVPLGYYREKLAVERMITESGLPWTTVRATQFHDLLDRLFGLLSRAGVLPVLAGGPFQPVDVRDVAGRLVELVAAGPAGRVVEFGGPRVRPMDELARAWPRATGRRRPVLPLRLPGGLARGVRAGGLTTPDHADGLIGFEEYLADRISAGRPPPYSGS